MSVALLSSNFGSGEFVSYLSRNFDTDKDGSLSDAEIAQIKKINVSNSRITSVKGLHYFTSLEELYLSQCNITSIDLTGLTSLKEVSLTRNPIASITFGTHPNLEGFSIGAGNAVSYYGCTTITALRFGSCPNLKRLVLDGAMSVTSVDVSGCPNLEKISIGCTGIQSMDVRGLTKLREFWCTGFVDGSYTPALTSLNAAGCTALTTLDLYCAYELQSLNIAGCSGLTGLNCRGAQLTSINLTGCSGLQTINVDDNSLSEIDLSDCINLREFKADNNALTSLDFRQCPGLCLLYASGNRITGIQFSRTGKNLELVCVQSNRLTALDVKGHSSLKWLWCWDNDFTALDIAGCTTMVYLYRNVAPATYGTAANPSSYQKTYSTGNSYDAGGRQLVIKPGITVFDGSPYFLTHPANTTVMLEKQALFTVVMRGDEGIDEAGGETGYQWQRRASNSSAWSDISYGTGATLSEQALYTLDGYQYRCAATNTVGTTYSDVAYLTINYSITITTHPQSQTVIEGAEASFFVTADGGGLHYDWQRKASGSDSWVYLDDAINAAMHFTAAREDNGCQYRCRVNNYPYQLEDGYDGSLFNHCFSDAATLTVICPPAIDEQPQDRAAVAGDTARFTVAARGDGLSYQWQRRASGDDAWLDLSGETGAAISVQASDGLDGYQYRCVVSNTAGDVITDAATLIVVTTPVITTNPSDITAASGSDVQFTADASGYGVGYQWQSRSGSGGTWADLNDETSAVLSLQALRSMSGYQYRCAASNAAGTATSAAATLTVLDPPSITGDPQDQSLLAGETAHFAVTADGDSLTYQWQERTDTQSAWSDLGGETGANLQMQTGFGLNGRQYRCAVENGVGTAVSEAATLTVTAVKITSQPANLEAASGDQAVFTVTAQGENPTYQWQERSGSTAWSDISGATSAAYAFAAEAGDDGRRYRCLVSGGTGGNTDTVTSAEAALTVVYPPVITRQPQSLDATAGADAALHINADGHYITYQWQICNDGTWEDIEGAVSGGTLNSNAADYSFRAVMRLDGAKYRCKLTTNVQSQSPVYSNEATLNVSEMPSITAQPADRTAATGTEARFSIAASGENVRYQWQKRTGSGAWGNISGATEAILTFTAAKAQDGSQYRCVASNDAGSAESNAATLTVADAPTITAQPQDSETGEGESARFAVTCTGDDLQYRWQERTDAQSAWSDSALDGASTAALSFTAQPAMDGMRFRCVVSNAVGSETSDEAILSIIAQARITAGPQSASAATGGTHTFTVQATGGQLRYRWQEKSQTAAQWEDADGSGADTAELTVNIYEQLNGFQYRCVVTNPIGSVTSEAATLTVLSVPVIMTHPRSVRVEHGRTARFAVSARGTGLRYQWQARENESASWADVENATAYQLYVTADAANSGAQYRCAVSNDNGSAESNAATLYVDAVLFHLADSDGAHTNILPRGSYVFALNASTNGAVYSLGFDTGGETEWVCEDESERCAFETDGERPLRIIVRASRACTLQPMLEAGSAAHGWLSPLLREHDAANDFNYDWFSIGNSFDSAENTIRTTLPCAVTLRYRPMRKEGL